MKTIKALVASLILVLLAACVAAGPKTVWHSFEADGWKDNWDQHVQLLEYRYENGQAFMGRKAGEGLDFGSSVAVSGEMPVANFLYLKWRLKQSGVVHERRIDLRPLLPQDMFNHKITFVIEEDQVYVYLVTPKGKGVKDPPLLKTNLSRFYLAYEIYPNNTRP
jgi:hypothetical protein